MAFDINKLPKWAIPLGIGGLVGVGVLMTRSGNKSQTPMTPIGVPGQEPGTTDTSIGMMLNQFFENFGKQNEQTLDTIGDLITAQNEAMATRDASFAEMIKGFNESIQDAIEGIELPSQPPNTQPPDNPNDDDGTTNPPPVIGEPATGNVIPDWRHRLPPKKPDYINPQPRPIQIARPKGTRDNNSDSDKSPSKHIKFIPRDDDSATLDRKVVSGWG